MVRPQDFGDFAGYVRWIKADRAGIEFREQLHPSVAEHLIKTALTQIDAHQDRGFGMAEPLGRRLLPAPNVSIFRSVA